jgi:hypothetical protein
VITAVLFGRWIYLAHKNLPMLEARHLRFSPGGAVGCFFIPVINLWGPYQAMRDLAKASRSPRQWELEDTPPLLIAWWLLWLVVQMLSNGLLRATVSDRTMANVQQLSLFEIASGVLGVPLYLLARYIVRRVWRDQTENYAQMSGVNAT